jgi:bifunctional non-homologous end joining protein LigD
LINSDFVLDGESIGDTFYVFDLLSANGEDFTSHPFQTRFATLQRLIVPNETIKPIVLATSTIDKKQLLASLQAEGKEGIVLKDLHAPYKPGRPASGGSQVKYKFYDTASVKVEKVNLKRSVSMCLSDDGKWISVGNVTIPPNYDIPSVDDIIEVRYLYAYRGGSLYQPTYLGKREDLDENDCHIKQLKYKSE